MSLGYICICAAATSQTPLGYTASYVSGSRYSCSLLSRFNIMSVKDALWSQRLVASMGTLWDGQEFRSKSFDDYFAWNEVSLDTKPQGLLPFAGRLRLIVNR